MEILEDRNFWPWLGLYGQTATHANESKKERPGLMSSVLTGCEKGAASDTVTLDVNVEI